MPPPHPPKNARISCQLKFAHMSCTHHPNQESQQFMPSYGCSFPRLWSFDMIPFFLWHRLLITAYQRMPTSFLWMPYKATTSPRAWSFLLKIRIQLVGGQFFQQSLECQSNKPHFCTTCVTVCVCVGVCVVIVHCRCHHGHAGKTSASESHSFLLLGEQSYCWDQQ